MKKKLHNEGNAGIEFAIILPVLLAIVMGVIEFGLYFIKDQTTLNAISSISAELRSDPLDPQVYDNAKNYGGDFMAFGKEPNSFCAKSYTTHAAAQSGKCTTGWDTNRPAGVTAEQPYYIALAAKTSKLEIAFSHFLPEINRFEVVQVGGSTALPTCAPGQVLLFINAGWECKTVSFETKVVTVQKNVNSKTGWGANWGANCPSGYTVAGCSNSCAGTEEEMDLYFSANGCWVDKNSRCRLSPQTHSLLRVHANCIRIVYK